MLFSILQLQLQVSDPQRRERERQEKEKQASREREERGRSNVEDGAQKKAGNRTGSEKEKEAKTIEKPLQKGWVLGLIQSFTNSNASTSTSGKVKPSTQTPNSALPSKNLPQPQPVPSKATCNASTCKTNKPLTQLPKLPTQNVGLPQPKPVKPKFYYGHGSIPLGGQILNGAGKSKKATQQTSKNHSTENYGIDDLKSDDATDDEEAPRKVIPSWAEDTYLKAALINQYYRPPNLDDIFDLIVSPDLREMFTKHRPWKRTSSANWTSPVLKPSGKLPN